MIRKATIEDVPAMLLMGKQFFEQSVWAEYHEWDAAEATTSLTGIITNTNTIVLVSEVDNKIVGGIGVVLSKVWFSKDTIAQEHFWYVDPAYKGVGHKLVRSIELELVALGVESSLLTRIDGLTPELHDYFIKTGYVPVEHTYRKRL